VEASASEVSVEDVYFRMLPSEIESVEVVERGALVEFRLKWRGVTFKVRRVRVAGSVASVEERGRMVEVLLSGETGNVRVRAWDEDAERLAKLKPGDRVEVLGTLRVYRGEMYVALALLRSITAEGLKRYREMAERDRRMILKYRLSRRVASA